jgi:hypothetical protein
MKIEDLFAPETFTEFKIWGGLVATYYPIIHKAAGD